MMRARVTAHLCLPVLVHIVQAAGRMVVVGERLQDLVHIVAGGVDALALGLWGGRGGGTRRGALVRQSGKSPSSALEAERAARRPRPGS